MPHPSPTCAILADRHTALSEGIRALLETTFQTVYTVADEKTLKEGAQRLVPSLIVLDLSLEADGPQDLMKEIHELSPNTPVMVLSVHDQTTVARTALADAQFPGSILTNMPVKLSTLNTGPHWV